MAQTEKKKLLEGTTINCGKSSATRLRHSGKIKACYNAQAIAVHALHQNKHLIMFLGEKNGERKQMATVQSILLHKA